jgi:Flp pilus assembly protein TadG
VTDNAVSLTALPSQHVIVPQGTRCDERGANLVELALLLPLLVLLLVGVADFGRAFNSHIIITNASREGARYASRFPWLEDAAIQVTIREAANTGIQLHPRNVAINGVGAVRGQPIKVIVTYEFATILGSIIGVNSLILEASTEMIVFGRDN